MRFLATLLWIIVVVAAVIFAYNNWQPITLRLWNDQVMDTFLPIPMIGSFVLGVLPYFILHRATRWSLGRKLASAERALANNQGTSTPQAGVSQPLESQPAPLIASPPGVL
jgi:lipopolysaccharide assembly protein A